MKTQITENAGPGAARILTLIDIAEKSKVSFVREAVIAGEALREQRHEMTSSRSGKRWNDGTKPSEECFGNWLKENCPNFSKTTAYNWMAAASRVVSILLEIHNQIAPVWHELEGERYFISTLLLMSHEDCTPAIRTFQDTFNTFLADRASIEAIACVVSPPADDSRIARAAYGKRKGGAGGNRRAYARFLAEHFKEMNHLIGRWDKFISENPNEHAAMTEAIRAVVLGGKFKVKEHGRPVDFKGWPKSFSDLMLGVLRERVRAVSHEI